jgi:hypothetical protein
LKSFLDENHLLHVLVNILTPYPGTEIRDEFAEEKRLLTSNPQKYNIRNVVFKPKGVSKEQLEEMYVWLCRSVFNYRATYRRGRPLLKYARRLSLPFYLRLPAVGGYLFTLMILFFRGKLRLRPAFWALFKIPYLILFNGTFYAMEILSMAIDYDDFANREEARFMTESVNLGDEDNLLNIPHKIVPVVDPKGKKYGTFYVDGMDLRRYGFPVPSENF